MTHTPDRARRGRLVLAAVAAPLLLAPGPAAAHDECDAAADARLVIDHGPIGGGVTVRCVEGGANRAVAEVMDAAGVPITWARGQRGAVVCRLDGRPADQPCDDVPPPDRSWALFRADPDRRTWRHTTGAVGQLQVPAGATLGWRFQDGGRLDEPAHVLKALPGVDDLGAGASDPPDTREGDEGPQTLLGGTTLAGLLLITGLCAAGFLAVRRRP